MYKILLQLLKELKEVENEDKSILILGRKIKEKINALESALTILSEIRKKEDL